MKLIYLLPVLLFTLPFVSSTDDANVIDLGEIPQGKNITLIQNCATCTFVNLTALYYPDSTVKLLNITMYKQGTFYYYNFTSGYNNQLGRYIINGFGNPDGELRSFAYVYTVVSNRFNPLALDFNKPFSLVLMIMLFIVSLIILFFGSPLFAGLMFIIQGMLILLNSTSLVIGVIFVSLGVIFITGARK